MKLKGLLQAALFCSLLLFGGGARAAQQTCVMPTSGTVSGLTLVQDINLCTGSLLSLYSGATAPSSPTTFMLWMNTTLNAVQQFDGTNWNTIWAVDATNHLSLVQIGGGTATLSSNTTTDLGSVPQSFVTISGTTTITSFGSSAIVGTLHTGKFSGALTLTYNATSMILQGGQSITTAAGDGFAAVYLGAGNWQVWYFPFSLPTKASPTTSDFVVIQDAAAANAPKKSLLSAIAALVGVTSIAGNQGAFTLGDDLTNSVNIIKRNIAYSQGYISGLTLSASGGTGTFGVAAGVATDQTNAGMMLLTSALSKTTGAWTVGTTNGALDTGSIAINTWYAVYAIKRPDTGVVDACVTLTTNTACATGGSISSAYTLQRRIGYMKTDGSSQWLKFTQTYDTFIWSVMVSDSGTAGTSRSNLTLAGVPTGAVVTALGRPTTGSTGGSSFVLFTSLQESDQAPSSTGGADLYQQVSGQTAINNVARLTDTLARIGMRASNAGIGINFNTYGWIDPRGK